MSALAEDPSPDKSGTRVTPPLLHAPDEGRHATWLELFCDLVFVVAVSQLGRRLSSGVSADGYLQYVGLFLPVWWAWVGHTVYASRFDTDDVVHRAATFVLMLAAAAMAVFATSAYETAGRGFAGAYVVARLVVVLLYVRAWRHVPEARTVARLYILGFSFGALCWAVSLLAEPPLRYLLWATGISIDLLVPLVGGSVLRNRPLDTSHMPERFGLFTLIVLGEMVLSVVAGASSLQWQPAAGVAAVLAFVVAVGIWWPYFDFLERSPFDRSLGSGLTYIYAHLPLVVGIAGLGVGLGRAIANAGRRTLSGPDAALTGGSFALWVAAFACVQLVSQHRTGAGASRRLRSLVVALGIGIAIAVFGGAVPPLVVVGTLAATLVALVVVAEHR